MQKISYSVFRTLTLNFAVLSFLLLAIYLNFEILASSSSYLWPLEYTSKFKSLVMALPKVKASEFSPRRVFTCDFTFRRSF